PPGSGPPAPALSPSPALFRCRRTAHADGLAGGATVGIFETHAVRTRDQIAERLRAGRCRIGAAVHAQLQRAGAAAEGRRHTPVSGAHTTDITLAQAHAQDRLT